MRAALVLALALAGCSAAPAPSDNVAEQPTVLNLHRLDIVGGRGRYTGQEGDLTATIGYDVPLDRVDPVRGHGSELVGASGDGTVVLVDRYATRATGPGDRCAADGREAWVRVFSLARREAVAAIPLESCRDRIAAADVSWVAPDRFRIETRPARVYALNGELLKAP